MHVHETLACLRAHVPLIFFEKILGRSKVNNENIAFRLFKDVIGCFKRGNRSLLILPIDVDFVLMKCGERFLWYKSAVAVDFSRTGKVKMHVVIFKSTGSDFSNFTLF